MLEPCHQSSELNDRNQHLLSFCPTRWFVRVNSLTKFLDNYRRVKKTLDEMLARSIYIADDRKSTFKGYVKKLKTMFFLTVAIHIFGTVEQLAKLLQNPMYYASDSNKAANTLKKTLFSFRSNEYFENMFDITTLKAEICKLEPHEYTKRIQK